MRLTPHFSLSEMTVSAEAARRRIDNTPSDDVLIELQLTAQFGETVRKLLKDNVVVVTSGYRSPALNRAIGGSVNSAHMFGRAVDFICPSFGTPEEIFDFLQTHADELCYDQLILEFNEWVHIARASSNPRKMAFRIGC